MAKSFLIFIFLLLIHLFVLVNLRFEAWPEMLVYPYLNLNNFLHYKDIIHPYPPLGIWFLSGFFQLFGISVLNLQILTWILILAIDILIFYIAYKKWGSAAALIGLAFFIIWQPLLDGNGLWFDLLLVPLLLIAYYRKSPLFLALSFFTKQSVIWLFPLFFKHWKKLLVFLVSLFLIFYSLFSITGTANEYLFWSWRVPLTLYPFLPGQKDLGSWRLWLIALAPFIPLLVARTEARKWAVLSFLLIFPRFGLFHLQPALAFAALSIAESWPKLKKFSWLLLFAGLLWMRQIKYFWHESPRFFEPEIISAAQKLASMTNPKDPVLFLNSPDQLMVLANRFPPKPWAITFPWYLELPNFQTNLVNQYQSQPIQAVVFGPYQKKSPYAPGSYTPKILDQFVHSQFTNVTMLESNISLLTRP